MVVWWAAAARAESWCAAPLVAHEWGVVRLGASEPSVPLPEWFARAQSTHPSGPPEPRVRELPRDEGMRDLPVLSLYTTDSWSFPVPFALEVGFTTGHPTAWWPPANALSASTVGWEALALSREPPVLPHAAAEGWVNALRKLPGALWVTGGSTAERFVFYEGRTQESAAVRLVRGESWSPTRPHYLVENTSDWPVHDVIVMADGRAWSAPLVPAHKTAGFLLAEPLDAGGLRTTLRARWSGGVPPTTGWGDGCVMMRDPAVPESNAVDHRLYPGEVDVLLDTWGDRMFGIPPGAARIVYREDVGAVNAVMPVKLYTDMYRYVELHRLSVVLVEGVRLP